MSGLKGYKLIGKVGVGGMATVYKGLQVSLNRPVAIKVLSKKLIRNNEIMEHFKRESLIIARLNNPHIIHVIDRGLTPKGMPYFVMEYVEGEDLAKTIKEGKLNINKKLELITQVCKALSYAHKNSVIHRDLKPNNILIDKEGNVRILDFGIAQFYGYGENEEISLSHTRTGIVMGTIPYMSPEQQISSSDVTSLSDIYSLGIMMYELFTGQKPLGRFPLPRELAPDISKPLEELIMKCVEQDPTLRPTSADEIKDQILKLLQGAHLETEQKKRASMGITQFEEKFALLDVIKEEPFGSVYIYEDMTDKELMVIKKKPVGSEGFREAKKLTSLKHTNIINIFGASEDAQNFIIVMEYLSGGSLNDRLLNPHPLKEFLQIAQEICEGLAFTHKNRIIHGNLRPSNILFSESGIVKVTDFGLDEHYMDKAAMINWYNMHNEPKSVEADIFAAGVIFYQLLTAELPPGIGGRPDPNEIYLSLPEELRDMIGKMISQEPELRQSSFDYVLSEITAIHNKYIKKIEAAPVSEEEEEEELLDATEILEQTDFSQEPAFEETKTKRRPDLAVILLSIYSVFATYMAVTGDLTTHVEDFIYGWHIITDSVGEFIDNTAIPTWEEFVDTSRKHLKPVRDWIWKIKK